MTLNDFIIQTLADRMAKVNNAQAAIEV